MIDNAVACIDCATALKPNKRRKTGRCKSCSARSIGRDPDSIDRRRIACREAALRDDVRARKSAAIKASLAEKKKDPAYVEARRELGRRAAASNLREWQNLPAGRPARIAKGKAKTNTTLGWCPPSYRDDYRHTLYKQSKITASEVRAAILNQIQADIARYANNRLPVHLTIKVREAARYLNERSAAPCS